MTLNKWVHDSCILGSDQPFLRVMEGSTWYVRARGFRASARPRVPN